MTGPARGRGSCDLTQKGNSEAEEEGRLDPWKRGLHLCLALLMTCEVD